MSILKANRIENLTTTDGGININNSGNVGIGTSSPSAALEIVQTSDMAVFASTTGTNNSARFEARSGNGTTSGKYAYVRFNNNDTNNQRYDVGTYGTDALTFRDVKAGSTRMTLDTSGNVGIGLTSPTEFVDIRKDQNAFTWAQIQNQNSSSGAYAGIQFGAHGNTWGLANGSSAANSNSLVFVLDAGGSNSEKMRIDSSGRVGIGTTSPGDKLAVSDGSNITELSGYSVYFKSDSTGYIQAGPQGGSSGRLVFQTNTAERMRIDSSGRLLVGTTSTYDNEASNLIVASSGHTGITVASTGSNQRTNLYFADGTSGAASYVGGFTYDHSNNKLLMRTASTERMSIDSSGVTVSSGNLSMHSGGRIFVGNGGNAVNPMFANVSDTNTGIAFPSADTMLLSTGGSERMRIDDSGRVGIGTSSPINFYSGANKFVVSGGSGDSGITIHGGTSSIGRFLFADGTSGADQYRGYVAYSHSDNNLTIGTDGSERLRVLAAGGLCFNGDSAAANALDDYEEGTFAPTIVGNTTAGTATYSAQRGKYTKIGDRVFFEIYVAWGSGTGAGSQLRVNGLPFTVQNTNATYPAVTIGYWDSVTHAANSSPAALLASNDTYVYFYSIPNGGGANSAIAYDTTGSMILSGHYKVN